MSATERAGTPWIVEQHWDLTYRHAADPVAATFFRTLRDQGRLLGKRCDACGRVLMPPRSFCDRDYQATGEWVEVGTAGTIELFTIMYHRIQGLPEPPYAIAYVTPDGADTALVNFVRGVDLEDRETALRQLAIGSRVAIEFETQRSGRMTDFSFRVQDGR